MKQARQDVLPAEEEETSLLVYVHYKLSVNAPEGHPIDLQAYGDEICYVCTAHSWLETYCEERYRLTDRPREEEKLIVNHSFNEF
ncbi:hypothetical protein KIN20_026047 [Parelaphostrongylus tenuis]|uniref:Uncharacterized protein n=1 Tax=Parelaphostrongylus tenuis TaxID=148309 RepID=A0AAD5QX97_PARTN|nr:hypothetical protein KIN20_026047 [Parelaphostrongylus tenuis]